VKQDGGCHNGDTQVQEMNLDPERGLDGKIPLQTKMEMESSKSKR